MCVIVSEFVFVRYFKNLNQILEPRQLYILDLTPTQLMEASSHQIQHAQHYHRHPQHPYKHSPHKQKGTIRQTDQGKQ
ncbi:hypothetical protein FGO68_gene3048 [Halteria grandinella]|uniref:Uncharacterized protein n=1 Tax=Halteria grandinella TaxID=5974 RepID=A0A8J8NX39_HALGN|nr:hypothetical protein FGO68_gene3048 [Halteria grandinella]